MSTVVVELYEALKQAGVDEALARDAASAVVPVNYLADLATKRDLTDLGALTKRDIEGLVAATKQDIEGLRAATKRDTEELRAATKQDIEELGAATKRDIEELGAATKRDIDGLGAATKRDIEELRAAVKFELNSEISNVRRDMAEMKAELIKWNVGAMAIMTAIFAAIARLT